MNPFVFYMSMFVAVVVSTRVLGSEAFIVDGILMTFEVSPEVTEGYDRDDWKHWNKNLAGGCFTVRDKVLAEESFLPVVTVPASGGRCRVTEGLWHDPYTGMTFTQSSQIQIDHVVALSEAHKSGGHAWTPERKQLYANDLIYSHHLMAVHGPENNTKSDKDPNDYLPVPEFHCGYVKIWLTIKHRWGLAMDQGEADKIRQVLTTCE